MARWEGFRHCPGCGFDFATGDGERSCSWGDCPYLPDELSVFCDTCRFNLFTMEGNPSCEDPLHCAHAAEPWSTSRTCARGKRPARSSSCRSSQDPSGLDRSSARSGRPGGRSHVPPGVL